MEPERGISIGTNAMKTKLWAILGLAVLVSFPARAAPPCLRIGDIYNWEALNDKTLIVEDNWHNKFKLSLMAPCINLTFKQRVGFRSIGGTQLSCLDKGDEVLVRDFAVPQRCPIVSVVLYTPAMEKADKAAAAKERHQNGH